MIAVVDPDPPRPAGDAAGIADLGGAVGLDALAAAYVDLVAYARALDEAGSWRPTRCPGWAARDLLLHLLLDAQRALVAFATPATRPPDCDAVTYWHGAPGAPDADSRGIRGLRAVASTWSLGPLVEAYAETTAAAVVLAGRTEPIAVLGTQGRTITARDLVSTLTVEAAVHTLDLPDATPGALPLAVVRATLDGLLGEPAPAALDDTAWALLGTGRSTVGRGLLGPAADRLPLLR